MKKQLTDAQKEKVLNTLLWIVAHPNGIAEGAGGKTGIDSEVGTGLRNPDAPLYNMPQSHRASILNTLLECGCIEQVEGKYRATEKGIQRASKEILVFVEYTYIYIKYQQKAKKIASYADTYKNNWKVLNDYKGEYNTYKQTLDNQRAEARQKAYDTDKEIHAKYIEIQALEKEVMKYFKIVEVEIDKGEKANLKSVQTELDEFTRLSKAKNAMKIEYDELIKQREKYRMIEQGK